MKPAGSLQHSQQPATCPCIKPARSSPFLPHPTSWSILILFSYLRLGLLSGLFSPPKPCIHLSCPPYALHAPPISFFSILSPGQYWVSSTFRYSPQHPILKHPQSTLLPQCQRPNFPPIQNNRQNYSSVYFNPCIVFWTVHFHNWRKEQTNKMHKLILD